MANTLGDELRRLRKSKKLTQSELAEKIGYSRTYLADTESNRRTPSMSFMNELAKGLGVSKLYLYKAAGYLDETDILQLVDENKRQREALEKITSHRVNHFLTRDDMVSSMFNVAKQALEGEQHEPSTD